METALPRDRITLLHGETSSGAQACEKQQASVAGGVFHDATV